MRTKGGEKMNWGTILMAVGMLVSELLDDEEE